MLPLGSAWHCSDHNYYAFVRVFGTPGNLLICVAIVTNPGPCRSSYYLLFSLGIADLIVTIICEPLDIPVLGKRTFFNDCAPSLERPCKILSMFSCAASVLHLTSISVDRLLAILFPLRQKEIMEKCALKVMLIVSWAFPILVFISYVVLGKIVMLAHI